MGTTVTLRDTIRADAVLSARNTLKRAEAALLDWDGCVAFGNRPNAAAIGFIAERVNRVAIVSNNSTNLPGDFVRVLERAGITIPADRIVLAGVEAIKRACEMGASRVLMLADGRMKAYGRNLGLNLVKDGADLVLLLRDTRVNYARLEAAANCISHGAKLIVANPDMSHPGLRGRLIPETGAILAALLACTNEPDTKYEIVGKPSARLFAAACQALSVHPKTAVMIGDNPDTDIAGAQAYGLASILLGAHSGIQFENLLRAGKVKPGHSTALLQRQKTSETLDR